MYFCNKCGYVGVVGPSHLVPKTTHACAYHAAFKEDTMPTAIFTQPPNCADCRFHESWGSPEDCYHWMCINPLLGPLIAPSTNSAVRCNETREFAFACGIEGRWFKPKT